MTPQSFTEITVDSEHQTDQERPLLRWETRRYSHAISWAQHDFLPPAQTRQESLH